jgi:glycosyltransferase involved in cell wall biosynthesis
MANQTAQLARLLRSEGAVVEMVASNAHYSPAWIGRVPLVRAIVRLVPYLARLWGAAGRNDVAHVMANSGWSWHLVAAPAVWIVSARGVPTLVNYRGGGAGEFFAGAIAWVRPTLRRCGAILVPSAFLQRVFETHGFRATIVPNVVDLNRFAPAGAAPGRVEPPARAPRLVVARHLERIYDNGTALRAFRIVRERFPGARLAVAGEGPERGPLRTLALELEIDEAVTFTGRLANDAMAALYRGADLSLNPSLADNMPISILESLASGVPVVSTNVGGIPDLVADGETASLVPPRDPEAMAREAIRLLEDSEKREARIRAGLAHVRRFTWEEVRRELLAAYEGASRPGSRESLEARDARGSRAGTR